MLICRTLVSCGGDVASSSAGFSGEGGGVFSSSSAVVPSRTRFFFVAGRRRSFCSSEVSSSACGSRVHNATKQPRMYISLCAITTAYATNTHLWCRRFNGDLAFSFPGCLGLYKTRNWGSGTATAVKIAEASHLRFQGLQGSVVWEVSPASRIARRRRCVESRRQRVQPWWLWRKKRRGC